MANRKVLINRHTSGNTAPVPADMYKGEIAVQHKTGEEILWTKNNNDIMVPFISCAQTISIIEGKIAAVDVVYDVNKKEGEPYINVETAATEGHKTFTLSTSGVASEANLNALSAGTVSNFKNMTDVLTALTDVVVTDISGDTIIVAEKVNTSTGSSNSYNLTHKQALATNGFNKLATDAYGHVTGSTAVEAADIEGLGFKNSAWTEEKIASAITALDVTDAAVAGQYVSSVSETDGKISVSRADVSKAPLNDYTKGSDATAVAATDTVNQAISKLENQIDNAKAAATTKVEKDANANHLTLASSTAADGSVTYTIGEDNVASKTDLYALSGAVESFTAATDAKFTELSAYTKDVDDKVKALSAGTIQLSADTVAYVNAVSGNIESVINAMDKAASAENGKVVTTVSEVDGVVSETKANVKDLQLGGYVKDTTATGDIASADTINAALSKLENKANAITIANADKSINVTTGATGTDINVNIKTSDPILAKDGGNGVYSTLNLVKIETGLPTTVKERYELQGINGAKIGQDIDIPKDSHIVSITYITDTADTHYQNLEYKYLDVNGNEQTEYVDMSSLVLEAEFKSGVTSTNGIVHGVVDPTSEKDSNNDSFLTVGADGFKVDGIKDEINAKIAALDVTDTAAAGQYVSAVNEVDGKVSMTRANVSEAILNNYTKGTDATAVAATDSVNEAISKLENQVVKAKAAATTKVVEGTDEGGNMTIVPTTGDDSSVTYTVNLTDVASKAALDAEIAARKAVDGQTGQTYAANTGATYITGATSLNDADVKLDAALKAVSDKIDAAKVTEGTSVENFITLTLDTATTAGTTALTINDSGLKTKIDEINSAITAETKARQDAIADLDSTAQTSGNGYFLTSVQLADGKITAANQSDKVNSASTADEAAHASAATKVDQKLTFADDANDVEYDGSVARTITFGTAVSSSGITGRSMSITNGVVDVEIIDCGEY